MSAPMISIQSAQQIQTTEEETITESIKGAVSDAQELFEDGKQAIDDFFAPLTLLIADIKEDFSDAADSVSLHYKQTKKYIDARTKPVYSRIDAIKEKLDQIKQKFHISFN